MTIPVEPAQVYADQFYQWLRCSFAQLSSLLCLLVLTRRKGAAKNALEALIEANRGRLLTLLRNATRRLAPPKAPGLPRRFVSGRDAAQNGENETNLSFGETKRFAPLVLSH
jgi:hypothetical protein